MNTPNHTSVLIVGGGAAGSMLAMELARFGIKPRIIDKLANPLNFSKAITIHARTLEIFDRIDSELARKFLSRGIHSPGYVIHYLDDKYNRSEVRPGLDFRELDCQYPFLMTHGQNETEATLRDYMSDKFNVQVEWGVKCSYVRNEQKPYCILHHIDGKEEAVTCDYLIACDGVNSTVRNKLQLEMESDGNYLGAVLQNLDVKLLNFPDHEEWMHYCVGEGHFLMVAKLPSGFTRLLLSQPPELAQSNEIPEEIFHEIISKHFDNVGFGEIHWHSRWQSEIKLAKSYKHGNIFLSGDAAHTHSTAGGQGLNCCIQDSYNLGWKLAMVIKGKAKKSLLETYETERKPIGHQVITAATDIHTLFMTGKSDGPDGLVRLQKEGFISKLVGKVSGISYNYRSRNENKNSKKLAKGDRLPNLRIENGYIKTIYEYTRHQKYTLFFINAREKGEEHNNLLQDLSSKFSAILKIVQIDIPDDTQFISCQMGTLLLLRPDGYIEHITSLNNITEIKACLSEIRSG